MRWLAALLGLGACGAPLGEARFTHDQCRSAELVEDRSDKPIEGAEDITFDPLREHIWISSYDRLTKAPGGIYRLDVQELGADILPAKAMVRGLRPHGIHAAEDGLLYIAHDDAGAMVRALTVQGATRRDRALGKVACGANDLTEMNGEVMLTIDREDCGGGFVDRVLKGKTGRVVRGLGDTKNVLDDLSVPNGIVVWFDTPIIAEMRGKRLLRPGRRDIPLPGAPDNLNVSAEGIVAAVQPQLWRFGLYRFGYTEKAPTRIVLVDPKSTDLEVLFEDKTGALFSGATAAVLGPGFLVASSVRGDRLLVCREPS